MGSGKGATEYWVAVVKPYHTFRIKGVSELREQCVLQAISFHVRQNS